MRVLTQEHRLTYLETVGELLAGRLAAIDGKKVAGLKTIQEALGKLRQLNSRLGIYWSLAMAIETLIECDQLVEARALCSQTLAEDNDNGDRHWYPEILRLKAHIEEQFDEKDSAQDLLQQAQLLANCQGAIALQERLPARQQIVA